MQIKISKIPYWLICWVTLVLPIQAFCEDLGQGLILKAVNFDGIVSLAQKDVENNLPFVKGDVWKPEFIKTAQEAVEQYFKKRGFFKADVHVSESRNTRKAEVILNIIVQEGAPCRIHSLHIGEPQFFKSQHLKEQFMERVNGFILVRSGDRYDITLLQERLRSLREWLVAEDYILANTENIRVSYNAAMTEADIDLAISYGERVTIGFQGNTVFSKGELNEILTQLRATGLGKDYLGVIQRKYLEEYKAKAYNDATIEVVSRDLVGTGALQKHITFVFHEGLRTKIDSLQWDGLSPENVKIAEDVFDSKVSRMIQLRYFVEKDFDTAIQIYLEELKSHGFLSCKLISKITNPVKKPRSEYKYVSVVVHIQEGDQTFVDEVDLNGFSFASKLEVLKFLKIEPGSPFNPFAFEEGLENLKSHYLAQGYLNFTILSPEDSIVVFSEKNRNVAIRVSVFEGQRSKVGNIFIDGLQKTRPYVVEREIVFHTEDWRLSSAVMETEQNLKKLGLFTDVKFIFTESTFGPEYQDVHIQLQEGEPGGLEVGPGFRSDLGVRAFSRVSYNNFFGKNWIGTLGVDGNRRINDQYRFLEYKADATFIEPHFFSSEFLYSVGISVAKQRFPPDFNASTTQFSTGFERKFGAHFSAGLFYKLERIRQFDVYLPNGQPDLLDDKTLLIGSVVPSITYDTRDNAFSATSGQVTTLSLEYADPFLAGGQNREEASAVGYYKWNGISRWYFNLTHGVIWSSVVAGGFERSNLPNRSIPIIKLFRLGGNTSIRGFNEDKINVDGIEVLGTLSYLNLRDQIEIPLVGELKFAPFIDAGNLYLDNFGVRPFFRAGAGVGLHYNTPIGPVNLDYGVNLNPQNGEDTTHVHFSVGMI